MHVNHIRLANPEHSCPPFSTPLFKWNKTVSSHQQWHSQFRNPAASIKPDWRHSFEVRLTVDLLTPSLCCAILCQLSTLFRLPLICFCLCCLGFCFYLVLSAPLSLFPLCLRLRCFEFFNSSTRKAFPGQHPLSFFFFNSCWWLSDKSALVGAYVRFKEEPAFPSEWQSGTRNRNFGCCRDLLVIICAGIVERNWNNLVVLPELK